MIPHDSSSQVESELLRNEDIESSQHLDTCTARAGALPNSALSGSSSAITWGMKREPDHEAELQLWQNTNIPTRQGMYLIADKPPSTVEAESLSAALPVPSRERERVLLSSLGLSSLCKGVGSVFFLSFFFLSFSRLAFELFGMPSAISACSRARVGCWDCRGTWR